MLSLRNACLFLSLHDEPWIVAPTVDETSHMSATAIRMLDIRRVALVLVASLESRNG